MQSFKIKRLRRIYEDFNGDEKSGKNKRGKNGFERYFKNVEIQGISVDSEVGDEPMNEEIMQGCKNRVKNVRKYAEENHLDADFFVASEAGLVKYSDTWMDFNFAVVENSEGEQSIGSSAGFAIPEKYVDEVIEKELRVIMDRIFCGKNLNKEDGGIGKLTHGEITRIDLTYQAFTMALIKFINGEIWK